MCEDVRVIIIKLADRLDNMRILWSLTEEEQKSIYKDCIELGKILTTIVKTTKKELNIE